MNKMTKMQTHVAQVEKVMDDVLALLEQKKPSLSVGVEGCLMVALMVTDDSGDQSYRDHIAGMLRLSADALESGGLSDRLQADKMVSASLN